MITETVKVLFFLLREKICENTILNAGSIVEISKLPTIILNGPILNEKKRLMRDPDRIVYIDREKNTATYEIPPRWYDLRFDVNISCKSNFELLNLIEKMSRINQSNYLLTVECEGREEKYRQYVWRWNTLIGAAVNPNISQVYQGRGEIIIYDVEVYSNITEEYNLIGEVTIDVDNEKVEVMKSE